MLKRLFRKRSEVKSVGSTLGVATKRVTETMRFNDPMLEAIHSSFSELEFATVSGKCLEKHKITDIQRAKMVDWMVEVTTQFECATQTFFLSVAIMDCFFARYAKALPPSELHVVGVTSMFIASKLEDVYPLRLKIVQERIGNGKISEAKIKATELTILRSLEFSATLPTAWDYVSLYFTLFKVSPAIEKTAECILRLSLMYYDTLSILPSKRALASFIIACTCSNRVGLVPEILQALSIKEAEISSLLNTLYAHILEYPETFRGYKSCARFLHFQLVLKVPGPLFQFEDEVLEREQKCLFAEVASC